MMKRYVLPLSNGTCPEWDEFLEARLERAHPTSWDGWYIIKASSYRDALHRAQKLAAESGYFPNAYTVIPHNMQYNEFHPYRVTLLQEGVPFYEGKKAWHLHPAFREGIYFLPAKAWRMPTEVML